MLHRLYVIIERCTSSCGSLAVQPPLRIIAIIVCEITVSFVASALDGARCNRSDSWLFDVLREANIET
jgi:hypothetical protein